MFIIEPLLQIHVPSTVRVPLIVKAFAVCICKFPVVVNEASMVNFPEILTVTLLADDTATFMVQSPPMVTV